jgi:hypothetical protein
MARELVRQPVWETVVAVPALVLALEVVVRLAAGALGRERELEPALALAQLLVLVLALV